MNAKRTSPLPPLLAALAAAILPLSAAKPPVTLELPSHLTAAGTTTTIDGQPWGFVVWNVNSENWLASHDVAVYLKPTVGGSFQLQGVMSPLTDPNAIKPWMARAAALGDDLVEVAEIAAVLHAQWKTNAEPLPAALENRLSMLGVRATQVPEAAAALRQLGNAHPLFRFVSATAWTGPLGVPNGQSAIIELRERDHATGAEGGVVGRVTLTAGLVETLVQPGPPVQVPPPFPATLPVASEATFPVTRSRDQLDLGVALRWSIPEALRRQLLLTRGFHLWRLAPGYTPPGGLNGPALVAAESSAPNQVRRLTRNPATASKVFRAAGSAESGPAVNDFTADRETWFAVDDNNRYAVGGNPLVVTGIPYAEGQSFQYVVAPVDLLGRFGPVSTRGSGVAVHTVAPEVPEVLRVENIMKNGNQRLRVVFKPNTSPNQIVSTTHYLIYRDRVKNSLPGPTAVDLSSDPAQQDNLIYLGSVPHPASPGATLSFDDDALVPQAQDFGQTYFYCVRAAHLGPLGYDTSAPSPAVFGTIRDRVGPNAPTGYATGDCPRVGIKFEEDDTIPEQIGPANVPSNTIVMRLEARRGLETGEWKDVEWVVFNLVSLADPFNLSNVSPFLFFGSGDLVWTELAMIRPSEGNFAVNVIGGNASGRFSHIYSFPFSNQPGGFRYRAKARLIGAPALAMAPPGLPNAEYWTPYFPSGQAQSLTPLTSTPETYRAAFAGSTAPTGRSLLVQRRIPPVGNWSNWDTTLLPANTAGFFFRNPGPLSLASNWRAWEIVDPAGSPDPLTCPHDARPKEAPGVSPIQVVLTLPIGSKEYRLYRRIDNGALTLMKQDVETWDDASVQAVILEDGLIPPAGGRIGYYGQVFDEHGNPSPLVLLGEKVTALPDLPIPTMDPAGSGGTPTAPTMLVRAFCPSPGVERIELAIDPPPTSASGLTSTPRLGSKLFNFRPGMPQSQPSNYTVSLMTPSVPEQDPSVPVVLDTTVNVKAGVEYKVQVRAIGLAGKLGDWSAPQLFTWTAPLVGDTVPWPAKPIPQVISWNPLVKAFRTDPSQFAISPERVVAIFPTDYPVAIRIGRVPLTSDSPKSQLASSNWNVRGAVIGDNLVLGYFGVSNAAGFGANPPSPTLLHQYLAPKFIYYGDVGSIDTSESLFPIVLYRRQTARLIDGISLPTPDTDLIQASSMINSISWVPDPAGNPDLALFIDPFVNVARLEATPLSVDLCLFDNSPVAAGATYQYYLVHFNSVFEPESIINAGTLNFPEAP